MLILFALAAVLALALSGPVTMLAARIGAAWRPRHWASRQWVYSAGGPLRAGGDGPERRLAPVPTDRRAPDVQNGLGQYGVQTDVDQLKARMAAAVEQGGTDVLKTWWALWPRWARSSPASSWRS